MTYLSAAKVGRVVGDVMALVAIDADGGWVVVVALDPADVKKKKKRACLHGWVVDADR